MPRIADVAVSIWDDPDFEALSLEAQHLYLWSFTNGRCGMAGLYRVSRRAMEQQSRVPGDRLDAALEELAEGRFAFYVDGVLWVRTRVRHLRQKTPNIAKAIAGDLQALPTGHVLVDRFLDEYRREVSDGWLAAALADVSATVAGRSAEGHPTVEYGLGEGRTISHEQAESLTLPRPSVEGHPTLQGTGTGTGTGKGGSEEEEAPRERERTPAREAAPKFNGRTVPPERLAMCERLLAVFNDLAGTQHAAFTGRGAPSESLKRIVGAATDHPQVSETHWIEAVRWRLTRSEPFWSGKPDTGVVFGPGAVSASIESARPRSGAPAVGDDWIRQFNETAPGRGTS